MLQTWRQRQIEHKHYSCNCGTGTRKQYQLHINDKGCRCLVHTGNHDQYAEIQSYKEGCDLRTILNGIDPNAVLNGNSTYSYKDLETSGLLDYTTMPKTVGEMFNLVRQVDTIFDGLPSDFRSEFNNNSKVFCNKFGSVEFNDILNRYNINKAVLFDNAVKKRRAKTKKSVKKDEVKDDES